MRRIIHNTTAVAACLSLLAPQFAQAQLVGAGATYNAADSQSRFADDPIILAQAEQDEQQVKPRRNQQAEENQRQRRERAEKREERQAEQRQEQRQQQGERAEQRQRRQADREEPRRERAEQRERRQERQQANQERRNAERPEAADREQERRRPQAAERKQEAERPRQQRASENRASENQASENQASENQERPRQRDVRQDENAHIGMRAEDRPRVTPRQQDDLGAALAAEREQRRENRQERAERQERQERRAAEERREDRREAAERAERREAQREREERQERREAQREREERRERQERREREESLQRSTLATGERARQRNEDMRNMSTVLETEVDRGLRDSDLRCLSGGSPPCGSNGARMVTPEGAVVVRNREGQLVLAPRDEQLYRVTDEGRFVRRAAEEDRRETLISREAARERRVAEDVAALLSGQGRVREERITRDNYRRSDQDFRTSLADALNDNRRDRNRDDDDDNGNDLMKALLLGGGALALGAMLNNNRQVALSSPDRVVLTRPDGSQEIIKDETALLRQPGSTVTTEEFDDGSTRTIVTRADGSKVVTIRDADLRVLRRSVVSPDGRTVRLIDDTQEVAPVDLATLPAPAPVYSTNSDMDEAALREALYQESNADRRFTLGQIRNVPEVRSLAAPVNIDAITFDTGSAAINAGQAEQLAGLGEVIEQAVVENPQEVFLIEGHTDTVGSDAANLALSDRRAESVALALSEY